MIRHNSLQSIALSAIALLAAAGGPAHAGAKKTAIKTLKASTAHIAKEVKKDAKLARLDLFSALDDTEHDVAQGLITGEDGALDVFIALAILQHQLGGIQEEATEDIRLAVDQATDILVDGGVLVPDYPAGFHHGDGGATDKLRAQIGKELGKVYMSVEKRLAKTRSVFEKKVHRALSCRLSPVNTYVERAGLGPHTDPVPLTIDVAVATSDLATANDVTIHVAGACYSLDGSISLMWANKLGGQAEPSINPPFGNRWSTSVNGLLEENYSLRIVPSNKGGGGGYMAIGAR